MGGSKARDDIRSLRAIPWIFAWTQTRLMLPAWLGVGDALQQAGARGEEKILAEMQRDWPFFKATLDSIEMVFSKANANVSANLRRPTGKRAIETAGRFAAGKISADRRLVAGKLPDTASRSKTNRWCDARWMCEIHMLFRSISCRWNCSPECAPMRLTQPPKILCKMRC